MRLWSCLILSLWVMLSFQNCAKVGFSNDFSQGSKLTVSPNDNDPNPPSDPDDPKDDDDDDPPPPPATMAKVNLCKTTLDYIESTVPNNSHTIANFALYNEEHYGTYKEKIVDALLHNIFGIISFFNVENFKALDYHGQLFLRTKNVVEITNKESEIFVIADKINSINNSVGLYCLNAKEIQNLNKLEGVLIIEDSMVNSINNFKGTIVLIRSQVNQLTNLQGEVHKLEGSKITTQSP